MGESDGGVLLDVKLNPDNVAKEFSKLERKAQGLAQKLAQGKQQLALAKNEASILAAQLDAAKAKLEEMKSSGAYTADQLKIQRETVDSLQSRYDAADKNAERLASSVAKTNTELTTTKDKAAQVAQEMGKGNSALGQMGDYAIKVENRLKRLASRVLFFSVFTMALRSLRSWFADVIKTDKDAVAAIAQLKGALLTLVQPLVGVVIPAFTTFLQVLSRVVGAIASVVASIFGTTVEGAAESAKNLNDEKKAIGGVGAAAKKAEKSLASFDEINKLDGSSSGSGGGGWASAGQEIAPDFSGIGQDLGVIEALVGGSLLALGAILTFSGANIPLGIALMAAGAATLVAVATQNWDAIKTALQGPIGAVTAMVSVSVLGLGAVLAFSGVNIPLGIALMAAGAVGLATVASLNWGTIKERIEPTLNDIVILVSSALLVLGGILAFSGMNVPLGIALMAAGAVGIASLVPLNWETIQTSLQGPVGAVTAIISAALLAVGAVLAFSGSNLPLGVALIAAGAAGLVTVGTLNWEAIQTALQGPVGAVTAIISAALLAVGAVLAFSGVSLPLGIALMAVGAVGLATAIALNWNAIPGLMQGPIGAITAIAGGAILVLGLILALSGVALPLGLALMAAGGVALATAIAPNWGAILEKIKEAWSRIKQWWAGTAVPALKSIPNFFIKNVINKLLSGAENFINFFIDGINSLIGKLNTFGFDLPDVLGGGHVGFSIGKLGTISLPRVPELAKGAVIPPNREFTAVLGDQTHGNNLEAPEDLIRQIVREESGGNYTSLLQQILAAIKEGKVMVVDQTVFAQIISSSMDSEDFRRGSPMVTLR